MTLDAPRSSFTSAAVGIMVMLTLTKILGFGEKVALAYVAGASGAADVYFVATHVGLLYHAAFDDVVAPVLLTRFVNLREQGDEAGARRCFRRVLAVGVAIGLGTVLVVEFIPSRVLGVVAPGFHGVRLDQAATLLRWTAPAGLLLGLSSLTYITLNAYRRFIWPTAAGLAGKIITVAGILLLMPSVGLAGAGVAAFIGAAAQLAIQAWSLRRVIGPSAPSTPTAAPATCGPSMLHQMAPLAVGTAFAQLVGIVDGAWASRLPEGSLAALSYARRFVDAPIVLLPTVLSIVAFPSFAALSARSRVTDALAIFARLAALSAAVLTPLAVMLLVAPAPVVDVLLRRGRFDEAAVELIARPLQILTLGLVVNGVEVLILRAYYALNDTVTPAVVGLGGVALHIALVVGLTPSFGIVAIPLGHVVQKAIKIGVLTVWLARRHPGPWVAELLRRGVGIALAGAAALAAFNGARSGHAVRDVITYGAIAGVVYAATLAAAGRFWQRG